MKEIEIKPLTREAFAPFGDVIETENAHSFPINGGKCTRYHDLAKIETAGDKGRPMISLVRGEPYPLPLKLTMVERHPLGSQAFIPLTDNPFLVVVSGGDQRRAERADRLSHSAGPGRQHRPQCLARHTDAAGRRFGLRRRRPRRRRRQSGRAFLRAAIPAALTAGLGPEGGPAPFEWAPSSAS